MKIVGVLPVRNEDWILGLSARAALMWMDELIIHLHACTDNSKSIALRVAREYEDRVVVIGDEKPVWEEMRHRQALLETARVLYATHIAIVDADEVLTGNLLTSIHNIIANIPTDHILQLPWLCLRDSHERFHASGAWAQQFISTVFQDSPHLYWKAQADGYDLHHRHPMSKTSELEPYKPLSLRQGGLMHLQFVSERRLRAKQALYKMNEVLRWPGREPIDLVDRRYNLAVYGEGHVMEFDKCPDEWWEPYSHLLGYLHPEAEPWQEKECKRLHKEYGPEYFEGLDLFGVV